MSQETDAPRHRPVLALVGPTATGKSDVAMAVARDATSTIEIVAADAFTVYRGMDVGTAKPSVEDRAAVPHHLVDVLDPDEETQVAWFQEAARGAIAAIIARGHVPLLVGGSGLYFRAVVDPLRFPPTDPSVRARLRERYRERPEDGHAHLREVDARAAAKIEPSNLRRTVRALEVIELTGEPFSTYDDAWDDYESVYPGFDVFGLTRPRDVLRERIAKRSNRMVEGGLLDEARALRRRYGRLSRTARQAIGYREAFEVLDGDRDLESLPEAIRARTRRYARRQESWFDKDPRVRWHDPSHVRAAWADV